MLNKVLWYLNGHKWTDTEHTDVNLAIYHNFINSFHLNGQTWTDAEHTDVNLAIYYDFFFFIEMVRNWLIMNIQSWCLCSHFLYSYLSFFSSGLICISVLELVDNVTHMCYVHVCDV